MRECDLCDLPARMYCESDRASLCWDCDAKVHGANFLVARHSRCLLCRTCQSPTPWRAAGPRLGPTFSVCDRCIGAKQEREGHDEEEEGEYGEEEEYDGDEEEEIEGGADEEDGDNQVVPWSMTPSPPVASSSSSDESTSRICSGFLKPTSGDVDLASQDNRAISSSHPGYLASASAPPAPARTTAEDEDTSFADSFRPSEYRKKAVQTHSASAQATGSLKKLHHDKPQPTTAILDICNRRDPRAVDLVFSSSSSPPI